MNICIFNKYLGGHYTIVTLQVLYPDLKKREEIYDSICGNDFDNMIDEFLYK